MCPNGLAILQDSVKRRFPADDSWVEWDHPRAFQYESTVADLIQEIVQRHATGIEFREYNVSPFSIIHPITRDLPILGAKRNV
jgi:glycogen debranching enzyme